MSGDLVSASVAETLSAATRRLRRERERALAALDVDDEQWEYAGRTWSWPGGESLTYFRDLAPGERNVLDRLVDDGEYDLVGVGTGRVAVSLPSRSADRPAVAKLARYGPSAEMGNGRPQNRRERAISERVDDHPFLPVLDADGDGDWVAMPESTVLSAGHPKATTAMDAVREALAPYRGSFHFDELKPENVGVYDGRYWVVDYGRPAGEPLFVEPPEAAE